MPCSEAIRAFTDSRATIWLTVTCLPTSRRKSSRRTSPVQSRLSTSSPPSAPVEVDDPADLGLDGGDVAREGLVVEQVALLGAPARVADHAGGPAGQGDRPVAGVLEAPQHQQADEVADVQAVGGRVAAVVER